MLGQHAGCFTTSFYIYIRHSQANLQLGLSDRPAKPIYNWVYQAAANQANTLLGLSSYSAKPANSWVYQTTGSQANTVPLPHFPRHQIITQSIQPSVGFIRPSTTHLHLYQQYTYINNQSSAKPTPLGLLGHQQ